MNLKQEVTATELALIAVALSKHAGTKPAENLEEAHSLWLDAWMYLSGIEARQADRKAEMRKPKVEPLLSFDEFLKTKMPKLSKSYRRKRFYDYLLTGHIPQIIKEPLTESQAAEFATRFFNRCKEDGASAGAYPGFDAWYKAKVSVAKAKGAIAAHASIAATAEAKRLDQAANREAKEKKSRLEYHDPEMLAVIAEKEQQAGGGSLQD